MKKKSVEEQLQNRLDVYKKEMANSEERETPFYTEKRDRLLQDNVLNFIFEDDVRRNIFIHYTNNEENARNIIKEGFKFVDTFYKTAEEIRNDETDLVYKHNRNKSYGRYLIVISIDKDIFNYYLKQTEKVASYEIVVEQLLTEKPPYLNEDSEMVYTFHHKYVKGYIDYVDGTIVENPDYDPSYNSHQFFENLKKLICHD